MFLLIEPQLDRMSGGLRYNQGVADASEQHIVRHQLAGDWPKPTAADLEACAVQLEARDQPVLLDGLIGCSLPEPLDSAVPVVQLVHALAETPEAKRREEVNLRAASAVITTSYFTAEQLRDRYGIQAGVAVPGVSPKPRATGGNGGNLISVGAVEDNKNQVFLARVLNQLHDRGQTAWHCTFAGPITDPNYAQRVRDALAPLPEEQAHVVGQLPEDDLSDLYHGADLLLLASKAETFGLVVHEAAAAGIPAVVTLGTGAEEALGAGTALALEEELWVAELEHFLTDAEHREALKTQAHDARDQLSYGWEATAKTILDVLKAVS